MKTHSTSPNQGYVVTVTSAPCTLSAQLDDGSTVVLLTAQQTGQFGFVAPSSMIQVDDDHAVVSPTDYSVAMVGANDGPQSRIDIGEVGQFQPGWTYNGSDPQPFYRVPTTDSKFLILTGAQSSEAAYIGIVTTKEGDQNPAQQVIWRQNNQFNLGNVRFIPLWYRRNWENFRLAYSHGVDPAAATPSTLDELEFPQFTEENTKAPMRFWFDIVLKNQFGVTPRIRICYREFGQTDATVRTYPLDITKFSGEFLTGIIIASKGPNGEGGGIYLTIQDTRATMKLTYYKLCDFPGFYQWSNSPASNYFSFYRPTINGQSLVGGHLWVGQIQNYFDYNLAQLIDERSIPIFE